MDVDSDIMLSGVDPSVNFDIIPSGIAADSLGFVAAGIIPVAEDIFRKEQTLSLPDRNHQVSTCDYCLRWLADSINAQGRMYDATNNPADLVKCSGCRTVRYCPECKLASTMPVSGNYAYQLFLPSLGVSNKHHKAECGILGKDIVDNIILHAVVHSMHAAIWERQ